MLNPFLLTRRARSRVLPLVESGRARGAYILALQRALRQTDTTWPLYCLLLAAADGDQSILQLANRLGVSKERIREYLRHHTDLFRRQDPAGRLLLYTSGYHISLSPAGESLLLRILTIAQRPDPSLEIQPPLIPS